MKTSVFYLSGFAFLCGFMTVLGQEKKETTTINQLEEVVLVDSRFAIKRENSGKTVVKISAHELAQNSHKSIAEIINTKSGIEINGSRSVSGQNKTAFIRGGNNRQVLVLIDGIQVSDASNIEGEFDLNLLSVDMIASIEIVKGAASTLYGNAAATAVINITTKKASNKEISLVLYSSTGSNNDQDNSFDGFETNTSAYISGRLKAFSYRIGTDRKTANGLSAVIGTESDPFVRSNTSLKLGYTFSEAFQIETFANFINYTSDYDNTFPVEDADFYTKSKQTQLGVSPRYTYENGSITVNTGITKTKRDYVSSYPSSLEAKSYILDAFHKYNFNNQWYTIIGFNYVNNSAIFSKKTHAISKDPYINMVWISDVGLNINIGGRLNHHSEYGNHFIYNLNPSYTYKFSESNYLKFLGSYSTSFIAPTLAKLYGDWGSNPNLLPEENTTFEMGIDCKLRNRFTFSTVYFKRNEKNFIDWVNGEYQNITTEFDVEGIEVETGLKIGTFLDTHINYTFTEKKDFVLYRVPKHKINSSISYLFNKKNSLLLNYQYNDKRTDSNGSELKSYGLFDLSFRAVILDGITIYGALSNVFNRDYVEIPGYTTKGRNVSFGLRAKF